MTEVLVAEAPEAKSANFDALVIVIILILF
jgi:hypothetical protein